MADYLALGLTGRMVHSALVSPDDGMGLFFLASGGLKVVKDPFSSSPLECLGFGAASGSLMLGIGTSASPIALGTTAGNALNFYLSTTATSGDVRGLYLRLYFKAAGASGEALCAFTTVDGVQVAVGGTINGGHISLGLTGAGAAISGQAFGLRVDFEAAASVTAVGGSSSAVALFETNIATGPTFPSDLAFLRFNNLGAQKLANFISITNPDTSAMFVNAGTGAGSAGNSSGSVCAKVLKILVGGTPYWIGLNSTNS